MNQQELREKTTKSIRQLREDIAARWDAAWLERLESQHIIEHCRYNINKFTLPGSNLVLERKDGKWWFLADPFRCCLESFDTPIKDFWPTLDLDRLKARAAALSRPPYKPLEEDEVQEEPEVLVEWDERPR